MLKEVIIFTMMLCPGEKNYVCVDDTSAQKGQDTEITLHFHTAVTPWRKVQNKTNYLKESKEVQFEK